MRAGRLWSLNGARTPIEDAGQREWARCCWGGFVRWVVGVGAAVGAGARRRGVEVIVMDSERWSGGAVEPAIVMGGGGDGVGGRGWRVGW